MSSIKENTRQKYEVASILHEYYDPESMSNQFTSHQKHAFKDMISCRSSASGGHINTCNNCGHKQIQYNSCRNRNCPKCQFIKGQRWVDNLKAKLLPCKYFHLVFTIPAELRALFMYNQKQCYDLLFKATAETIKKVVDKRHRVQTGSIGVMHTWTQTLEYHPHIHYILTAGGITDDQIEWRSISDKYLAPQEALSSVFRALLCRYLREGIERKAIELPPQSSSFKFLENKLFAKRWRVFIEKPFKGADSLVNYLGKYVHRVALSNRRIKNVEKGKVTLSCRDNKNKAKHRLVTMPAEVFITRFSKHIIPSGFYKIRYFGIFASVLSQNT